jgi:probable F420-dependent oxidoreductase
VVERDPIVTAKEVASLDLLSGGRMLFGVGAGWNREEMRDHGTDPATRFALLRERVEAMKAIWTEDEASYHGRFVSFDALWSWPKPVQRPHPPVLVGGTGPRVLERVVAYGDAWLPNRVTDDDVLVARIEELQRLAAEAGRDPIPVTVYGASLNPARLARWEAAGVERAVYWLPSEPAGDIEPHLDRMAASIGALATAGG